MLTRVFTACGGLLCLWTSIYAALNFNPPIGADPGGVRTCWLTFIVLGLTGIVGLIAPVIDGTKRRVK